MKMMGKIIFWNRRESNGFIRDILGNCYYFEFSSIINKSETKNVFVYFEILENIKGVVRACNIRFAPKKDTKVMKTLCKIR